METEVVNNTVEYDIGWWDDPGDYPCGAGGSPLPGYAYLDGVSGTVVFRATFEEGDLSFLISEMPTQDTVSEWTWAELEAAALRFALEGDLPPEIDDTLSSETPLRITRWSFEVLPGNVVVATPEEWDDELPESDCEPDYYEPEPDFDRFDDRYMDFIP